MDNEHMNDFDDEEFDLDSVEAEYLEMIEAWEDDEDDGEESIPELYFSRPDPYAKRDIGADPIGIHFREHACRFRSRLSEVQAQICSMQAQRIADHSVLQSSSIRQRCHLNELNTLA